MIPLFKLVSAPFLLVRWSFRREVQLVVASLLTGTSSVKNELSGSDSWGGKQFMGDAS